MDATEFIKTFIILVAVIDPIGNIPVYIALTSHKTDAEHKSIALKTSCSAVLLLVVSFLFGKYIITEEVDCKEDISLMPLTFPLFIGPAALSIVIIQSDEIATQLERVIILSEFILVGFLIWITLKLCKIILNSLSKTGIKFIHQIMGLLLGSLAIGINAEELKILLPGLS